MQNSGTDDYCGWLSMLELDQLAGHDKGSAFRAFKRLRDGFNEGADFIVLDHQSHAALASALQAQGRLYRSSVTPVLLAPDPAKQVLASMQVQANHQ